VSFYNALIIGVVSLDFKRNAKVINFAVWSINKPPFISSISWMISGWEEIGERTMKAISTIESAMGVKSPLVEKSQWLIETMSKLPDAYVNRLIGAALAYESMSTGVETRPVIDPAIERRAG